MQRLWSIISIYSIFTHSVIVMIYQLSARSEGIAFWCFGELETYWTEWFIDVHWLFCRDCNWVACPVSNALQEKLHLPGALLDSGQVRIKVESIVPQSRGAFFEFSSFCPLMHWFYDVFSTPFWEVSDAALPPETRQKWVSNRIEFQPKSFATSEKSNDFGHHFNHFHPRHVQAENLAHQHFNDLFKQYPSSFIQVR